MTITENPSATRMSRPEVRPGQLFIAGDPAVTHPAAVGNKTSASNTR